MLALLDIELRGCGGTLIILPVLGGACSIANSYDIRERAGLYLARNLCLLPTEQLKVMTTA